MRDDNPFEQWPFRGSGPRPGRHGGADSQHGGDSSARGGPPPPPHPGDPRVHRQPLFLRRVADRVVAAPLTLRYQRGDRPTIVLTFDVEDDALVCTAVQVESAGGALSARDLADLPLDQITDEVRQRWTLPTSFEADDATLTWEVPATSESPRRFDLRSFRGRFDSDLLQHIAEVYTSNPDAPTRAVADAFGVAHRTASLYAKRARESFPGLFAEEGGEDTQTGGQS